MNPPIKSAFPKIQGRIDPVIAQKNATATKAVKLVEPKDVQKESLPPRATEPLPSSVELWIEVVSRPDREVFGWTLMATRAPKTKAVLISLNRHHALVHQCFELGDSPTLALLAGICVAELLLTRQKREAWLAATLAKLRETLLPEHKRHIQGVQFLAQTLAGSDLFIRIGAELIAPGGAEAGKRQVGIVNIEQAEPQP
jgi:hypothetical protein